MFLYCLNKELAIQLMQTHKLIQLTTDSKGNQIWIFNKTALPLASEYYSKGEDYFISKRLNF